MTHIPDENHPFPPQPVPGARAVPRAPAPGAPEAPDRYPTCGRLAFGPVSSELLDLLILIHDHAGRAKSALESVVLP